MLRGPLVALLICGLYATCASPLALAQSSPVPYVPSTVVQPSLSQEQEELPVADGGQNVKGRTQYVRSGRAIGDAPEDVANLLQRIEQRQMQREGLIPFSLLGPVRE